MSGRIIRHGVHLLSRTELDRDNNRVGLLCMVSLFNEHFVGCKPFAFMQRCINAMTFRQMFWQISFPAGEHVLHTLRSEHLDLIFF